MNIKKLIVVLLTSFIIGGLLTNSYILASASNEVVSTKTKTQQPSWKFSLKSETQSFITDPYHVPNTDTLYVTYISDNYINTGTKVWSGGVVSAIDIKTGKVKWSYETFKKGPGVPWSTDFAFSKKGTVYALDSGSYGHKLISINVSGKQNWVISVPEVSEMYPMNDGSIILIDKMKKDSDGKFKPYAYAYNANGKKLGERFLHEMYSVIDGQYVITQIGPFGNCKLDVFGPQLNRIFTYTPPTGAVTYVDQSIWTINNSEILIRMNLPKTGNRLIALNSKGKTLWGRKIEGNASVQSAGQNYVVYEKGYLSLYGTKGLIRKKAYTLSDPMGVLIPTLDNKIAIYSEDWKSVIDPSSLEVIYQIPYDIEDTINRKFVFYHYAGNGYLYEKANGQLTQYKLLKNGETK